MVFMSEPGHGLEVRTACVCLVEKHSSKTKLAADTSPQTANVYTLSHREEAGTNTDFFPGEENAVLAAGAMCSS